MTIDNFHRCARRKGLVVAITVTLAAILAAGCGSGSTTTLNVVPAEHAIASSILSKHGVHTIVACPPNVPKKAGQTFTCTARLDVGAYPVTVVETNGRGHVRYESKRSLVVLDVPKVEHAIKTSIAQQRKLTATVTCPTAVLQRVGLTFTCSAVVHGKAYPFEVTETDSHGHVRYVGR